MSRAEKLVHEVIKQGGRLRVDGANIDLTAPEHSLEGKTQAIKLLEAKI